MPSIGPSASPRPCAPKPPPMSLTVTVAEMNDFINGCEKGNMREVEWFLKYRPEQWGCHRRGKVGLMYAAQNGYGVVVEYLLRKEFSRYANVNATCAAGMTALLYAAKTGHPDIVKTLLEHKAS